MESNISLMTIGVLLLGAVFPVALIMTWVYFRDRLREPVSVVVITMTLGGVIAHKSALKDGEWMKVPQYKL